jgi:hypothetical protein
MYAICLPWRHDIDENHTQHNDSQQNSILKNAEFHIQGHSP